MRHPLTEELGDCDFAADIHSHLRKKEKERVVICGRSTQLHLRPSIVRFLHEVCSRKKFCAPAQHLAMYFLDAFLEGTDLEEEHWQPFVLGCLSVAVKLEENGDHIPSNRDLCAFLDSQYIPPDIMDAEVCLLEYFEWDILHPTAAHFAEYYELYATAPLVDGLRMGKSDYELLKMCIRRHIEYFLNVVLEDIQYYKFSPSIIAASCIVSARIHLMLIPPLPLGLRSVTHYHMNELKPCIKMLMSELHNDMTNFKLGHHQTLNQCFYQISSLSKIMEKSL